MKENVNPKNDHASPNVKTFVLTTTSRTMRSATTKWRAILSVSQERQSARQAPNVAGPCTWSMSSKWQALVHKAQLSWRPYSMCTTSAWLVLPMTHDQVSWPWCACALTPVWIGVFTLGDAQAFLGLASKSPPLGSTLNLTLMSKDDCASPNVKTADWRKLQQNGLDRCCASVGVLCLIVLRTWNAEHQDQVWQKTGWCRRRRVSANSPQPGNANANVTFDHHSVPNVTFTFAFPGCGLFAKLPNHFDRSPNSFVQYMWRLSHRCLICQRSRSDSREFEQDCTRHVFFLSFQQGFSQERKITEF